MRVQPKAERASAMPWENVPNKFMRPERVRESIPHISFIKFNFVSFQKRAELVLKRNPFVMLALVANVFANPFHSRLAHRKRAVTALPKKMRELRPACSQPIVGALFYLPDDITQRFRPGHYEQQMCVVRFGIDFDGRATESFERPAHVGVEVGANVIRQNALPIFRGENQVDVNSGEGLRHGLRLSRPFRAHDDLGECYPGHRFA